MTSSSNQAESSYITKDQPAASTVPQTTSSRTALPPRPSWLPVRPSAELIIPPRPTRHVASTPEPLTSALPSKPLISRIQFSASPPPLKREVYVSRRAERSRSRSPPREYRGESYPRRRVRERSPSRSARSRSPRREEARVRSPTRGYDRYRPEESRSRSRTRKGTDLYQRPKETRYRSRSPIKAEKRYRRDSRDDGRPYKQPRERSPPKYESIESKPRSAPEQSESVASPAVQVIRNQPPAEPSAKPGQVPERSVSSSRSRTRSPTISRSPSPRHQSTKVTPSGPRNSLGIPTGPRVTREPPVVLPPDPTKPLFLQPKNFVLRPWGKRNGVPTGPSNRQFVAEIHPTQLVTTTPSNQTRAAPSVPTGPRAIPTGPKSSIGSRAIPTGPRLQVSSDAPASTPLSKVDVVHLKRDHSALEHSDDDDDDDMPRGSGNRRGGYRGSSRGGGGANGSSNGTTRSSKVKHEFEPPLRTKEHIQQEYEWQGVTIKPMWLDNPKAPLANYLGQTGGASGFGQGGQAFESEMGWIDGQLYCRASVIVDQERGIIGIGDDKIRKEAEKLAALDALFQLAKAGLLEGGTNRGTGGSKSVGKAGSSPAPASSLDTATLSDGTVIDYDKARLFTDYYCKRFKFGKPEITFEQVSTGHRKGPAMTKWEAVMTVGGRKIGMGSGNNKKEAQLRTYLDVTTYLESCDHELWVHFLSNTDTHDIGLAPHLQFIMSDRMHDYVYTTCEKARDCDLYRHKPRAANTAAVVVEDSGGVMPSASTLHSKSSQMRGQLNAYEHEQRYKAMREVREALPITAYRSEICDTIERNEVTVLVAATGSGKSTQTPSFVLDHYIKKDLGSAVNIFVTQPRRLAATSVSARVAEERGQTLGQEVGYQVRFDSRLPRPHGSITFVTVGIFLKRLQSALSATGPSWFDQVSHIMVDEVHERDMDTDLLLTVLKTLLVQRRESGGPPLRLVLMSATVNAQLFSNYFDQAPVLDIPGRLYPVTKQYLDEIMPSIQRRPLPFNEGGWVFQEKLVTSYLDQELGNYPVAKVTAEVPHALTALIVAHVMSTTEDGDLLVFIPGLEEMKKVSGFLLNETGRSPLLGVRFGDRSRYEIHMVHSSIPAADQKLVFEPAPAGVRRVILGTNICEASITLPRVTVVIDTGSVKRKEFDPARLMSSLVTSHCGTSNLDQRAGRAGRVRPGDYFGLFSRKRLATFPTYTVVEMQRLDLSEVVMHVKALNLGDVEQVLQACIEPPARERVHAAMTTLSQMGALEEGTQNLTPLGRVLLSLPIDARLAKMCVFGVLFKCLSPAITLASILAERDAFLSPISAKAEADAIKDQWSSRSAGYRSDAFAILNAFEVWLPMQERGSYREANEFLQENFLSKQTMLSIMASRAQLYEALRHANILVAFVDSGAMPWAPRRRAETLTVPAALDENAQSLPVRAALVAIGSAPNFAIRTNPKMCRTAQHKNCTIHPSSVNSRRREESAPQDERGGYRPEKRIYAYQEAVFMPQPGGKPDSGQVMLRNVTRLDGLNYLMFAAYHLQPVSSGLLCDDWLPIAGRLDQLDDIQRLRILFDDCMLRVFEGLYHLGQPQRRMRIQVSSRGQNNRAPSPEGSWDGQEHESDDDDDDDEESPYEAETRRKKAADAAAALRTWPGRLTPKEIEETNGLIAEVVRVLDMYASERDPAMSRAATRPSTPVW